MSRLPGMVRWSAFVAVAIGYILLAHYTMATPGNETLGALIALSPILILVFSIVWRAPYRNLMLTLLAIGCMALFFAWRVVSHHYSHIYWIEHVGTQIFLFLMFARSLMQGREPVCTYFARILKGQTTPEIEQYTRQITIAWVIFFGAMAATSTVLFYCTSLAVWSIFANFLTLPLTAVMFIVEYAARRYLHPNEEHVHILAVVKAYWDVSASR